MLLVCDFCTSTIVCSAYFLFQLQKNLYSKTFLVAKFVCTLQAINLQLRSTIFNFWLQKLRLRIKLKKIGGKSCTSALRCFF